MAKIPESIGPYKISSSLGRGGTSQVYRAVHPELKKTVVLKKLTLRKGTTVLERFKREAEIMMSLQHPNIVRVFDIFKEGRSWVIVQEFVEGLNLAQLIHLRGKLPPPTAAWIMYQSARALHYVHRQGIIHRDIKPSNIFISKDGEIKLGDFGIAARIDDSMGLTLEGATLGTPAYMPPEQLLDPGRVDRRADVYALGISFFEALTGRTFQRHPKVVFSLLGSFNGATIERATRKSVFLRYYSMGWMKLRLKLGSSGGTGRNKTRLTALMAQDSRGRQESGELKTPPHRIALVFLFVLAMAALPLGGIYVFKEWVFSQSYGRMRLTLQLPEDCPQWLIDSPQARLYRQKGETLGRSRKLPLHYSSSENSLSSRKGFFPSGYYRLQLNYLDGMEWISFYLPNRQEQRQQDPSILLVGGHLNPVSSFPLYLDVSVSDCLSGMDLGSQAKVDILMNDTQWTAYADLKDQLRTDRKYTIRVEVPGYQPFFQTQYIGVLQRHVKLRAALVPQPGLLYLEGTADGVDFKIEGQRRYLSLEDTPRWKSILFDGKPLQMLEGHYSMSFFYRGIEYPLEMNIQSDEARWIRWETDGSLLKILTAK